MKRFISFVLVFVMITGTVASAAPGDIIYTGTPKTVYRKDLDEEKLVQDIIAGASIDHFYREIKSADGSRKFINIVNEEKKHDEYIGKLINSNSDIKSPEDLRAYMNANKETIQSDFENITNSNGIIFDKIPQDGSLDDYFGNSKVPMLTPIENYSRPVPGSTDGTSQIINLTLPRGANSWVYKLGREDFVDLQVDTSVSATTEYRSGRNINVEEGQYLFLGALDGAGKLKAYASIEILEGMIRRPKELVEPDASIIATFNPSINYSGATTVKITSPVSEDTWKVALLDTKATTVYKDMKFNSTFNNIKSYIDNTDILVANDSELDNGLTGFKKFVIIYKEVDGKIEQYNIFDLNKDSISGILKADTLISEENNPVDYNYSTPLPGSSAASTRIITLNLPEGDTATKWMYAIVGDLSAPNRDRVYDGSQDYVEGSDIKINPNNNLMILATDDSGKVRAYDVVKVEADMIKNPLATELKEFTHYKKPLKGTADGSSMFEFLKHDQATSWKYITSDTVIDNPELDSKLVDPTGTITVTDNVSGNISIESDLTKLKSDNFRKHMMVYGLDSEGNVKVFKNFTMNDFNVKMPIINKQVSPVLYEGNGKGNSANTTRFKNLVAADVPGNNLKFKYKVIDDDIPEMEFNEQVTDAKDLRINADIFVNVGKHLLIIVVDGSNKTKAFTTIPLAFNNVMAGDATLLEPTTHYKGPVPGSENNSSQFTFLSLPTGASKFVYQIGDTSFGIPEAGSEFTGDPVAEEVTKDPPIKNVAANKYLQLLAIDGDNKIVGYREFRLSESQVKGGTIDTLTDGAYKLLPGNTPSSTRLRLEALGLENPNSIRWRYKLVSDVTHIPYFNEIVDGGITYNVNSVTFMGSDITVVKDGLAYGNILILATDGSGRTKGYKYVEVTSNDVKEHAPEGGITIKEGTKIDSVIFNGLDPSATYKYLISNTRPETPAKGDNPPALAKDYDKNDIQVLIGKHISLYKLDVDGNILEFNSFEVEKVAQGTAKLEVDPAGDYLLEGNLVKGGTTLTLTLTEPADAKWVADIVSSKSIRDKMFNGFKADSETSEWAKVVSAMVADGNGAISLDDTGKIVTIYFPKTLDYNITKDQIISLTIPYEAMVGAKNDVTVEQKITIKPTVGARISGHVVSDIVREADIIAGGKTIVITLADGTWAGNVNEIINQFKGGTNWGKIVTEINKDPNKYINRDNGSTVTITLPKVDVADIDFGTTPEVISLKIDKAIGLIPSATEDVVASPDFTLYPNRIQVVGHVLGGKGEITLEAPDYRVIAKDKDTWIIDVTRGTLEADLTNKVTMTGLPRGLTANVSKVDGENQIQIKLTGTASATLATDTEVKVKIKGSAITEPNSVDSDDITFKLVRGTSIIKDLENVGINAAGGKLLNTTSQMEYSLNSTNGTTSGIWHDADAGPETNVTPVGGFKPGKVFVRDKNNPKVFHLVTKIPLAHAKAPTGVSVSSVDYSEADKMKVMLDLPIGTDYDYSLDGGKTWTTDFVTSSLIPLEKDSDLRVRYRATVENLESLATPKINVLDLRSVDIDVASGMITGTTNAMEYSLNDGDEGSFVTARANGTSVKFENGSKVVIRQRSMIGNKREIGIMVTHVDSPTTDVSFNILDGKIIDNEKRGLQYRIATDPWKLLSSTEVDNPVVFKPGKLEVRAVGTTSKLPSEVVSLGDIKSPDSAPELRIDDFEKTIEYKDGNIWNSLGNLLEYQVNSGEWKDGSLWHKDQLTNNTDKVGVRIKATENTLPSLIKIVNFTGNLTFEGVKLNVAEGKIEGTTTAMQYSTTSTNGLDGTWIDAKAGGTMVSFAENMKVYIREKSKPLNSKSLTLVGILDEGIQAEVNLLPDNVNYDISQGLITNKDIRTIQYRIGSDSWKVVEGASSDGVATQLYDVVFKAGELQFRVMATDTTLASPIITKDNIQARASAPELKYDDVKHKIIDIDKTLHQYNVDGGDWIDGNKDMQFEGGNVVLVRLKATDKTLPSQEQKITFVKNLDLNNVILNVGNSQLENTSTLMEYSLDSINGEDGQWFLCATPSTNVGLKKDNIVHIRSKAKPRHFRKVTTEGLKKKKLDQNFVVNNLRYSILERTISVTGTFTDMQNIINDLQYRVGTGNWINIDYVTIEAGDNVLAYNVNFIPGNLEFRLRGDVDNLPSDGIVKEVVKSAISAPNVIAGFDLKDDNYRNELVIPAPLTPEKLEYAFGANGPWINGKYLTTEDLVGKVYVRIKADAINNTLPSLIKELEFTPVVNLKTIVLSPHVSPIELNGTTADIQYNINGAGWKSCIPDEYGNSKLLRMDNKTPLDNLDPVHEIWIRDSNQHGNIIKIH